MSGEYADIDIMLWRPVFQKTENFPVSFHMENFIVFATKTD